MTAHTIPQTKLLKSRIKTTRFFAIFIVFLLLFSTPISNAEDITEWAGYFCMIAAVIGRMICTMYVGGRKNAVLVTDGPYSLVRNPLYVFSFIGVVGIGLISGMISIALLLVIAFILYYPKVVAREEGFLSERFGDTFANYKSKTPTWIPNFRLWHSPDSIDVNPKFVLITLRDALAFLLVLPVMELIEYSHNAGWLPVLFHLY